MQLIDSLKNLTANKAEKISNLTRKIVNLAAALIGIKKKDKKYDFHRFTSTAWIFLVGIPLGLIFFGSTFSIGIWGTLITIVTIFCNLDYAFDLLKDKKCIYGYSYT